MIDRITPLPIGEMQYRKRNCFYKFLKVGESLLKEMDSNYFENDIMDDDLTDALEWGMSPDEIVIPAPIRHVFWKQILKNVKTGIMCIRAGQRIKIV